MPTYDYQCDGSEQVFEVNHPMATNISTWAELAERGGFDMQAFPADTSVRKIIASSGGVVSSSSLKNPEMPPCATGGCGGGMCGM